MIDYHINIFYSEADEGYIADIPDLGGCTAFGKTPAIALEEVQKVKEAWIVVAQEANIPIPPPRYRPLIYQA
jgi:predicted RNase H-like HicB family nuclease